MADGSDVWIFDTGGTPRIENLRRGGLWLRPTSEQLGVVVYILVDDIDATLQKASAMGGRVVVPRTPQGASYRACFSDPDGNVLGLWEEPPRPKAAPSEEDAR
jgi:predicted enzyme related to lactoylglutathione lyase